jgi:hypothetical protein
MPNPFTTQLPGTGVAKEYGYAGDIFDTPSTIELGSTANPDLTGLGGGVAAYRGNQGDMYPIDYHLQFANGPGIQPSYQNTNPAPGSADLTAPRDQGGPAGTSRIIQSDGPVTGNGSQWTGLRGELYQPNPNYAGPGTGGPDYAQTLASTYQASQAQLFSELASASAMVSAV